MRHVSKLLLAGVLSVSAWASACADIFGIHGGTLETDGSVSDTGVVMDAPFDGGYVNPDADYADCGTGARSVSADAGFFVSKLTGSGTLCSIDQPCATLAAAIAAASQAGGGTIFIARGTYPESLLFDLNSKPLAFQGGWDIVDGGWVPQCVPALATIAANGQPYVVELINTPSAISFTLVQIVNAAAVAPGTTLYGIIDDGSALVLTNVEIFVADAGDGVDGVGAGLGNPATCLGPADGLQGATGANGSGGRIVGGTTGLLDNQPTGGNPGGVGDNGTDGGPGNCVNCGGCKVGTPGDCDAGGFATCNLGLGTPTCANPGNGGCGGAGGGGGNPGSNGGSSVGVYISAGTLLMTNGAISTGSGGLGGTGATGASGMSGASGAGATSASCFELSGCFSTSCMSCMPMTSTTMLTATGGSAGGTGGTGGQGGQGGGGSGGDSVGIFSVGGSVTRVGVTIAVQPPASGGQAAGSQGFSGQTNGDF